MIGATSPVNMRYTALLLLSAWAAAQTVGAQETNAPPAATPVPPATSTVPTTASAVPPEATENPPVHGAERLERMSGLLASLAVVSNQLDDARRSLDDVTDEPTRKRWDDRINNLLNERSQLQDSFEELAVGPEVDRGLFTKEQKPPFDLRAELEGLAEPLIDEMKKATAEQQRMKSLRDELQVQSLRATAAGRAVTNLAKLIEGHPDTPVTGELIALRDEWDARFNKARSQYEKSRLQLREIEDRREPFFQSSRKYLTNFMKSRGLHLLLGVAAFCLVFFGLRALYAFYRRFRPLQEFRSFASRLFSLLFHLFTTLAAVGALLLTFNLTNDWFLLTLTIIFLIGVAWVSIKTLPAMFEQVKLMLNFGAVRENELVIHNDIPWRVDDLGLTAKLINPRLSGGEQILPIRDLVGMNSRRPGENELWFPTEEGDWILFGEDPTFGRVVCQTPLIVTIEKLGGSRVTMPTADFLAGAPENLSDGFRVETRFGIDYKHQAEATTTVVSLMQEALDRRLREIIGEPFDHVTVEFIEAGPSSLDYEIETYFDGGAAHEWEEITRHVPTILVDACNEHGWVIPFTQVTIHKAD